MDRILNPKDEKQSIYDIYRACRLCGGGAGYKMPIIQNVVDLDVDGDGIELRQKILECVQIEVNHTDRMPPLICELCVDKVNDFYQFLEMCRQTNKRTRLRLGLPLKMKPQGSPDSDNCILGVTEPVYQEKSDEPLGHKSKKVKIKREPPEHRDKKSDRRPSPQNRSRESSASSEEPRYRETRRRPRTPSPVLKRTTRQQQDVSLEPQPEGSLLRSSLKRLGETSTKLDTPPVKKVKLAPEPTKPRPGPKSSKIPKETTPAPAIPSTPSSKSSKPSSKIEKMHSPTPPSKTSNSKSTRANSKTNSSSKTSASKTKDSDTQSIKNTPPNTVPSKTVSNKTVPSKAVPSKTVSNKTVPSKTVPNKTVSNKIASVKSTPAKVEVFLCEICNTQAKNQQGLSSHCLHKHTVSVISPKYACNACELWFLTVDEATKHHREHREQSIPYKCTRCYGYFKGQQSYEDHFGQDLCLSSYEVPDVECERCWRTFPTVRLLEEHRCGGGDNRPGGKCVKCDKNYALLKNLTKHESSCNYRKKGEVIVDSEIQARLLPMTVRIARCDALLTGHVSAAAVSQKYGLDSKCTYPYLPSVPLNVKEPASQLNHIVSINDKIKDEFCTNTEIWGDNDSESSQRTVDSLSSLSLNILSKSSKDPKTVKSEDILTDPEMSMKIDSIIDNLADEEDNVTCSFASDSILDKNNTKDAGSDKKNGIDKKLDQLKDDSQTSFDSDSILDKNDNSESACAMETDVSMATAVDCEQSTIDSKEGECIETPVDNNQEITPPSESNTEEIDKQLKDSSQEMKDLSNNNDLSDDSKEQLEQNKMDTDLEDAKVIASEDNDINDIRNDLSTENETIDVLDKDAERIDEISSKVDYDMNVRDEFDKRSPNNEDLSKIDEITTKILQETESQDDLDGNNVTDKSTDTVSNGVDDTDKNINDNNDKVIENVTQMANKQREQKKPFLIDDLLKKPDDLQSLELDSISDDEFNFDV